jgi:hypothetical protein
LSGERQEVPTASLVGKCCGRLSKGERFEFGITWKTRQRSPALAQHGPQRSSGKEGEGAARVLDEPPRRAGTNPEDEPREFPEPEDELRRFVPSEDEDEAPAPIIATAPATPSCGGPSGLPLLLPSPRRGCSFSNVVFCAFCSVAIAAAMSRSLPAVEELG